MRWPRSPEKNSAFGRSAAKRREKPQLRDADVLRLVHDRGIVGRRWTFRLRVGQGLKHCGLGHQAARLQSLAHLLEDLPQNRSSCFRQTCPSAEALDVPVGFPRSSCQASTT